MSVGRAASGKPWAPWMLREPSIGQMCNVTCRLRLAPQLSRSEGSRKGSSAVQALSPVQMTDGTGRGTSEDWRPEEEPANWVHWVFIKPSIAATNGERGCEEPTETSTEYSVLGSREEATQGNVDGFL